MTKLNGFAPAGEIEGRESFAVFYQEKKHEGRKGYLGSNIFVPVEEVRELVNPEEEFDDDRT
jgi:hypothetical protein